MQKLSGKKIGCISHDCAECAKARRRECKLCGVLTELTNSVMAYLSAMDAAMGTNNTIPLNLSKWIGTACNELELRNDIARNFLDLPISADGKATALKKLRLKAALAHGTLKA